MAATELHAARPVLLMPTMAQRQKEVRHYPIDALVGCTTVGEGLPLWRRSRVLSPSPVRARVRHDRATFGNGAAFQSDRPKHAHLPLQHAPHAHAALRHDYLISRFQGFSLSTFSTIDRKSGERLITCRNSSQLSSRLHLDRLRQSFRQACCRSRSPRGFRAPWRARRAYISEPPLS